MIIISENTKENGLLAKVKRALNKLGMPLKVFNVEEAYAVSFWGIDDVKEISKNYDVAVTPDDLEEILFSANEDDLACNGSEKGYEYLEEIFCKHFDL